jgi:cell wall-associated NlpC family hydrolase
VPVVPLPTARTGQPKGTKIGTAKPGLASSIDDYLDSRGSPMAGLGHAFVQSGRRFGVDPRLLVGIGVIESSAGKYEKIPNNFANWSVHDGKGYSSHEEAIHDLARGLRQGYISKGLNTPQKIVRRYAPGSDNNDEGSWAGVVSQVMQALGGNPAQPVGRRVTSRSSLSTGRSRTASPPPGASPPGPPRFTFTGGTDVNMLARSLLSGMSAGQAIQESTHPIEMVQRLPAPVAEAKAKVYGGTVQDVGPAPGPTDAVSKAIQIAKDQIGKPYVFGSAGPGAFDCSGLIEYAFEKAGIKTPGRLVTGTMSKMGQAVPWKNIEPGDWIVRDQGGSGHVVLYAGNGQVIAAPHTGEVVQFQPLSKFVSGGGYQVRRWHGG